jgi:hypothetical protein
MLAHLYIMEESFKQNAIFSTAEIEEKIKRLAEDLRMVHIYKDSNKLYANFEALYPKAFYGGFTVEDFLCNVQEVKKVVDRDVINALIQIFEKTIDTKITSKEVREELLNWTDAHNCHGLIVFHPVNEIDPSVQLIYGIDGWYRFRRYFLGKYPNNGVFFIDECKKYYPKIFLHERTKSTIIEILNHFAISITIHLGYLNDILYKYRERSFINESEKYRTFSIECQLEHDAASKDKLKAKETLTWNFTNDTNQTEEVTCYPHLRLCKSDIRGDSFFYQHRIYFHEGVPSIKSGNILVGHIGLHL